MVMAVTQLEAVGAPRAHQNPTKNFGDSLQVTWTMRNNGQTAGAGRIKILNPGRSNNPVSGVMYEGSNVTINAGAQVNLSA